MSTLGMSPADIEQAIKSIAEKKDDLQKTFEILQSYSSSTVSVTLQWKDIDDHVSSIMKSIEERFQKIKNSDSYSVAESPAASLSALKVEEKRDKKNVQPRPNLRALCTEMDGKGLIWFINDNRKDIDLIRRELGSALLCAPDPVTLVLDLLDSFIQSNMTSKRGLLAYTRSCTTILECLKGLSLEIKPLARNRARELVVKLKEIKDKKEDNAVVLIYLFLIATFGLLESYDDDYIFDLIILVGWTGSMVNLCRNCALEEKIPDLVNRFISINRPLVAVKFVLAFNLQDKYPLAPLLEAYVNYSKNSGQKMRHGGKKFSFKRNAFTKEIAELKATIKIVKEYKLESVYPCEDLHKCIRELEKEMIELHQERAPIAAIRELEKEKIELQQERTPIAATNSTCSNFKLPKELHQKPNKRPRPSTSAAPVLASVHLAKNNHAQHGLVDQAPYAEFARPYGLSVAPSIYYHGGNSSFPANYAGVGALHALPMPHLLPSQPLVGPAYFDMAAMNGGYLAGLPAQPPFNPSFFP